MGWFCKLRIIVLLCTGRVSFLKQSIQQASILIYRDLSHGQSLSTLVLMMQSKK